MLEFSEHGLSDICYVFNQLSRSIDWSLQRYFMNAGISKTSNLPSLLTSKCSHVLWKYYLINASYSFPLRCLYFSTTSFDADKEYLLSILKTPDGFPSVVFYSRAYSIIIFLIKLLGLSSSNWDGSTLMYSFPFGVIPFSPALKNSIEWSASASSWILLLSWTRSPSLSSSESDDSESDSPALLYT